VCPSRGVSNGQLADLIVRELRAHSETRHESSIRSDAIAKGDCCPG
jgi:hypothetical protein